MQCEFKGRDFQNVIVEGQFCGMTCLKSSKCTHFTWKKEKDGGVCYLKSGSVTRADAVLNQSEEGIVCGIKPK